MQGRLIAAGWLLILGILAPMPSHAAPFARVTGWGTTYDFKVSGEVTVSLDALAYTTSVGEFLHAGFGAARIAIGEGAPFDVVLTGGTVTRSLLRGDDPSARDVCFTGRDDDGTFWRIGIMTGSQSDTLGLHCQWNFLQRLLLGDFVVTDIG